MSGSPGSGSGSTRTTDVRDRVISLGPGLPAIPERLLLAHARGRVLFIAGAGISRSAGLPDFRGLVLDVYAQLDKAVFKAMSSVPSGTCNQWTTDLTSLTDQQAAEVRRFIAGDYDVVLGMLERRMDERRGSGTSVRTAISGVLRSKPKPAPIHRALMRLADRGGAVTIVTTNFERLLQASTRRASRVQTYTLGGIPRPGASTEFAGVFHIHGVLDRDPSRASDFVVSDQDFGEYYMRRRIVPDFIYDAARIFHLVLVGYSANDAPMRYLLNAVAADDSRFEDVRERFTFIGGSLIDHVTLEDWRGRRITPIHYDAANAHSALLTVLERWADLSAINGKKGAVDAEVRRIVRKSRAAADVADRDLFDHLIRRSDANERARLSALASKQGADLAWLDAAVDIAYEGTGRRS